jgi:hypothetical protein
LPSESGDVSPPAAESHLRVGEGQGEQAGRARIIKTHGGHLPPEDGRDGQQAARGGYDSLMSMAPNQKHPPGPPMDLANMRRQGVHHLIAYCLNDACRHQAIIDVGPFQG